MNSSKSTDHLSLGRAPEGGRGEGKGLGSFDVKTDNTAKKPWSIRFLFFFHRGYSWEELKVLERPFENETGRDKKCWTAVKRIIYCTIHQDFESWQKIRLLSKQGS